MTDYITSKITGKKYRVKDCVRILNIQQVAAYLDNDVELLDVYVSKDRNTDKKILVYIFNREESKEAYDLWCKRELN